VQVEGCICIKATFDGQLGAAQQQDPSPLLTCSGLRRQILQVEGRIRTKEFAATFDAQLGAAKRQKSEASDKEAKRLAFYIFFNVKRDFDRCV